MHTRRFTRWTTAALFGGLALTLAACSGSGSDKAGGVDEAEPRVLTLASQSGVPRQLTAFADEVSRRSDGTLKIEFKPGWRLGESRYEVGTFEDVKTGEVDMAWVGARAFDTVGVRSFQALLAPLLVDSYDLEARVFEEGIPERMLEGVDELGIVGIGVLPGPMRKVLGVSQPFVRPDDFAGQVVGIQNSEVAKKTLKALGATPSVEPAGASLEGLDAYEQQLSSIVGNQYDRSAEYVTSNVNLWPRPLVVVMGEKAFESLTPEQQSALREAAAATIPGAVAESRAEDKEATGVLCRRGMTFAVASGSDLAELREELEPVYAELRTDAQTSSYLDAIADLKTEIAASAEAAACDPDADTASSAAFPDGRYESTITRDDWSGSGWKDATTGRFTMIFEAGDVTVLQPKSGEVGFAGTYTVFRDRIKITGPEDQVTARWSFDGEQLRFTDIDGPPPHVVVMGSHPWARVAEKKTVIDGVYRTSFTLEALQGSPKLTDAGEVNNENWGDFTLTLDRGRVTFEQKNEVANYTTSGVFTVDGNTVVLKFTEGGNAGETFAFRWSLYQDTLTFERDEALGVGPTPYVLKPWRRVR